MVPSASNTNLKFPVTQLTRSETGELCRFLSKLINYLYSAR